MHDRRVRSRTHLIRGSSPATDENEYVPPRFRSPQLRYHLRHGFNRSIDFLSRGVAAKGETDRGVDAFAREAYGLQYVRRFRRTRSTGGAGLDSDSREVEGDEQILSRHALERNVGGCADARFRSVHNHRSASGRDEPCFELIAEPGYSGCIFTQAAAERSPPRVRSPRSPRRSRFPRGDLSPAILLG